jgi:signal transduction histidine kinase
LTLWLTIRQGLRMFLTLLAADVLVAALFLTFVLANIEITAGKIHAMPFATALDRPLAAGDYTVHLRQDHRSGVRLPNVLDRRLPVPDILRALRMDDGGVITYILDMPVKDTEGFIELVFFMDESIRLLNMALGALITAEAFMLIIGIWGMRNSIRKTLRPIQELTWTAQTIGTESVRAHVPGVGGEDGRGLELDGTIHTLNTITAKRLDTRISIADERQELRGLAQAINDMLDRLDAAYQSQLRFVSDASHELRTPIAVVQGYANLLDRWGKEDPVTLRESIIAIKSEAQGMQALVEQLLFLARSDNNTVVLALKSLDISALTWEVLRDTQLIDDTHVFSSNIVPNLQVVGDAQLLKQAVRILMDNAIKYTPLGESISLLVYEDAGYICVTVSDHGIGIPDKDIPHVFDRFFRSDESRARKTGGAGLGLSIAKWTVERHGGFVEILSRENVGTKMTMALPALPIIHD